MEAAGDLFGYVLCARGGSGIGSAQGCTVAPILGAGRNTTALLLDIHRLGDHLCRRDNLQSVVLLTEHAPHREPREEGKARHAVSVSRGARNVLFAA